MRSAIEIRRALVAAIVADPTPPDFSNTLEALERSSDLLERVTAAFFAVDAADSSAEVREAALTIAPELAAHEDDITLDAGLFGRIESLHEARSGLTLDREQEYLLDETRKRFLRAGVNLDAHSQARLREINSRLASLEQTFGQNLLAEAADYELHVTDAADLGSLPKSLRAAASREARRRGHKDGWSFTLARTSVHPLLSHSPNRALRREAFEAFIDRGRRAGSRDNRALLREATNLRAERAGLLGHGSHAHFVLADNMAETPERVRELLDRIWEPALAAARAERTALAAELSADGFEGPLEPWDWRYYAERLRASLFALDEDALRPYFEFNAVRQGAFELARRLFGLEIVPLEDVPTWHAEQQAFQVSEANGRHIGILYMDFFARGSKREGAWMSSLVPQHKLGGETAPVVTTNFNFSPPTDASPALLSYREVQTVFHEFGHALHGLLSDVTYPSLSGTRVPRDFVELPSQILENWMSEPEMLRLYARHHQTGEVIPNALIDRLEEAATFNQGFATLEYLAAAYLDLAWHSLPEPSTDDVGEFECRELERLGLIAQILPRYRSPYFAHIFAGGYSAGYYSYLWAEVLDADGFSAFKEAGLFDPATAALYRRLLSQGGSRPGMELYREFRGRDPRIEPLLERRGFA